MIALLGWLVGGMAEMGTFVAFGVEVAANAILAAVAAAAVATMALLPSMSDAPVIGHPQWLDWLSWFYPVGDLIAGLTLLVTMWVAFLAVRWLLRLVRAL